MAKAEFKVVVRGGKKSREAVVRPPYSTATRPAAGSVVDAVTILNKTDERIWVRVPAGVFDLNNNGAPDTDAKVVEIAAQGLGTLRLPAGAPLGAFSFQVFCEESFSFAQGNSDLEFIIEN